MGLRVDPITKASTQTHGGVDIAAPFGTPLVAILDGTVHQARGTTIGGAPVGGFGAWVVLEHKATDFCGNPKTVYSLYGHVSRAYVRKGDIVKKGQRVADVGNEGTRTTGNHLHFEIHFDKFNTSKSSTSRQNPIDALGLQW
jgi:murein DD-endopeptidase MepM/ murein hydrolase activator NlpD